MAHWAELDENNIVIRVVVGDNNEPDEGYQWIIENLGGRWIKTSYNNNFRKTYAAEGFKYDESLDIFIRPKPYESWIFDENTYILLVVVVRAVRVATALGLLLAQIDLR